MSRDKAKELLGEATEIYLWEKAEMYHYAVRRVLGGESKEDAVKPMRLAKVLVPEGPHQCSACGSRRCTSVTLQMRRADESATVFCKCSEDSCGKVWRC